MDLRVGSQGHELLDAREVPPARKKTAHVARPLSPMDARARIPVAMSLTLLLAFRDIWLLGFSVFCVFGVCGSFCFVFLVLGFFSPLGKLPHLVVICRNGPEA